MAVFGVEGDREDPFQAHLLYHHYKWESGRSYSLSRPMTLLAFWAFSILLAPRFTVGKPAKPGRD